MAPHKNRRKRHADTTTYWVKHITSIQATTKPFSGFWMNPAYRVPVGKFPVVARFISQETPANTPITEADAKMIADYVKKNYGAAGM